MSIKGIIFDLDGTLADTMPVCLESFRRTFLKHAGRRFSDEEIFALYGPNEEGILQKVLGVHWELAMPTYLEEYRIEHKLCPVAFAGIEEALGMLKDRGVLLGVATGKGARSAKLSLDLLGLTDYFGAVETGSEKGGIKPDMIRKIAEKWGLPTSEVAYLGDWPSDVDSALEAGAVALAAGWADGSDPKAMIGHGPEAMFSTVQEFAEWIEDNL